MKIKDELNQIYSPEPANTEKMISPPSLEIPQQEESVTRIKVEAPPIRRVNVHHFEEEKESANTTTPDVTESRQMQPGPIQTQPKINDPYREPVDNLVDLSGNTNS